MAASTRELLTPLLTLRPAEGAPRSWALWAARLARKGRQQLLTAVLRTHVCAHTRSRLCSHSPRIGRVPEECDLDQLAATSDSTSTNALRRARACPPLP